MNTITPQELKKRAKTKNVCVLDVRSEKKFASDHIKQANIETINIPKGTIFDLTSENMESISDLPKGTQIVVTCTTGNSAKKCAKVLIEKGYDVIPLDGGITSWNTHQ